MYLSLNAQTWILTLNWLYLTCSYFSLQTFSGQESSLGDSSSTGKYRNPKKKQHHRSKNSSGGGGGGGGGGHGQVWAHHMFSRIPKLRFFNDFWIPWLQSVLFFPVFSLRCMSPALKIPYFLCSLQALWPQTLILLVQFWTAVFIGGIRLLYISSSWLVNKILKFNQIERNVE